MKDLRTLRRSKNLTQAELAELTGLTDVTVFNVEHGRFTPQRGTRARLEAVLGPVDWELTAQVGKLKSQGIKTITKIKEEPMETEKLTDPGQIARPAEPEQKYVKVLGQRRKRKLLFSANMSQKDIDRYNEEITREYADDNEEKLLPPQFTREYEPDPRDDIEVMLPPDVEPKKSNKNGE